MVKNKTTQQKNRTVSAAPKKKKRVYRNKNGYQSIGPAMATVGLVAANAANISDTIGALKKYGMSKGVSVIADRGWQKFVTKDQLVKDGLYLAGGYIGGELVKKYAPSVIKKPIGKIAKKIPKVI